MKKSEELFPFKEAKQKLTNHAKRSLLLADAIAKKFQAKQLEPTHLLFAIFSQKGSLGSTIMKDLGFRKEHFGKMASLKIDLDKNADASIFLSEEIKKTFSRAFSIAKKLSYPYVGTEHLIYALLESKNNKLIDIIAKVDIKDTSQTKKILSGADQLFNLPKLLELPEIALSKKRSADSNPETPFVDNFCVNVNKEIDERQEIIVGRNEETERMIHILGRKNKNNPLLLGSPGVGKTALISKLAHLINIGEVPFFLQGKRIMSLDVPGLIAGTSFRGEFESRLKEILNEVSKNKRIILFIDEIHNIIGAGNVSGSLDLANIIKPALARGDIQLIGATTFAEYKKYIEKDAALDRRFQPIEIKEPTLSETREILLGIRKNYEKFHNVTISDEAINLAVDLSSRYIQQRFLPDKAIDVLDETASEIRSRRKTSNFGQEIKKMEDKKRALIEKKEKLVAEEAYEKAIAMRAEEQKFEQKIKALKKKQKAMEKKYPIAVTPGDIIATVARISRIPKEKLLEEKNHQIKNIAKILEEKIVGQKEVLEKLSGVLIRSQFGLASPDRPFGSFLFLGPTGVGKTLTAKVLSQEFFGGSSSLIRIDMSEFMERHSVSGLIGAPAGYVGYGEGGRLTEKIRRHPYAVVLFDEIEKAHPDVHNLLLQILEDGVLTDAQGLEVSFKNTVIILTSNFELDEDDNAPKMGFEIGQSFQKEFETSKETKEKTLKALERMLRPELLNRLDHLLVFNALGEKELEKISAIELSKLKSRLEEKGLVLKMSPQAAKFIAKKSDAKNQGARLIRKNIQELVENQIAEMIMGDKIRNNAITVEVKKDLLALK